MKKTVVILVLGISMWTAESITAAAQDRGFWLASVGQFNALAKIDPIELGLEWRGRPRAWKLQMNVGLMINADKGGLAFAGARRDFHFSPHWGISLGLGAGLYEPGDGLDLGGPFQLRTSLELFHLLSPRSRLGASFSHVSNGGIYSENEGANSVALVFGRRLD